MKNNKTLLSVIILCILLAMLLFLFMRQGAHKPHAPAAAPSPSIQKAVPDTTATLLPVQKADTEANPLPEPPPIHANAGKAKRADSVSGPVQKTAADNFGNAAFPRHDSIDTTQAPASLQPAPAPKEPVIVPVNKCSRDTVRPWVYADPAGGLHYKAISVRLSATKPCIIKWKTDEAAPWNDYSGELIYINKSKSLMVSAIDSCGNRMEPRREVYEIRPPDTLAFCPGEMVLVKTGDTAFCIDRYEWPNKKGRIPRTYVSIYQAIDTCASVGKRLCASDEWTRACSGPEGWRYPYGPTYELHSCVSNDTMARPSGSKPDCRGYYGTFDMSGNCAEWTNTKSSANKQFYNVMGGFWESSQESGCFDSRYSYFPQNRHNPVGFRCCKDALPRQQDNKRGAE